MSDEEKKSFEELMKYLLDNSEEFQEKVVKQEYKGYTRSHLCQHEFINVGFHFEKWVCKVCGEEAKDINLK